MLLNSFDYVHKVGFQAFSGLSLIEATPLQIHSFCQMTFASLTSDHLSLKSKQPPFAAPNHPESDYCQIVRNLWIYVVTLTSQVEIYLLDNLFKLRRMLPNPFDEINLIV